MKISSCLLTLTHPWSCFERGEDRAATRWCQRAGTSTWLCVVIKLGKAPVLLVNVNDFQDCVFYECAISEAVIKKQKGGLKALKRVFYLFLCKR